MRDVFAVCIGFDIFEAGGAFGKILRGGECGAAGAFWIGIAVED